MPSMSENYYGFDNPSKREIECRARLLSNRTRHRATRSARACCIATAAAIRAT